MIIPKERAAQPAQEVAPSVRLNPRECAELLGNGRDVDPEVTSTMEGGRELFVEWINDEVAKHGVWEVRTHAGSRHTPAVESDDEREGRSGMTQGIGDREDPRGATAIEAIAGADGPPPVAESEGAPDGVPMTPETNGAPMTPEPDVAPMTPELDLASRLFHRIESFLSADRELVTVPPDCPARDAIRLMEEHRCSRLPVVDEHSGEVLGVFSYRSFARVAARNDLERWTRQKCAPGDLSVDEFLEQVQFARRAADIDRFRFAFERDGGVLVGTPAEPEAILTCMDLWRHYEVAAGAFVMLREIELAVRELIRIALADDEEIAAEARRCLASKHGGEEKVPVRLGAMTFNDYILLVSHGDSWSRYEPLFGGTRTRTKDKLDQVREVRNKSFHFRQDEISDEDRDTLRRHRAWLLAKVKQVQARRGAEEC